MTFLFIVVWNVLWYFSMHGILSARFKSSAIPSHGTELMVRNYLFKNDIAFTNELIQIPRKKPTMWRRRVVDYDPTGVLDEAYHYLYKREHADVEIIVEVSNQTLSMYFKPHCERVDPPESVFHSWLSSPCVNHKKKTYQIGEDCIRCGDNTFAFRYVTTSGGYGLGLLITEVISTISFGADSLNYEISRTFYGLTGWVIPCVNQTDDTRLTFEAIDMAPHFPSSLLQSAPPAAVSITSVPPKVTSVAEAAPVVVSSAITTICGADPATADRYEARNDVLRSIMRDRHLPTNDVAALTAWLASTNDVLRVERLAALKNDVMNLLRAQEPPPPGLADTLVAMFESETHPPAVLDYCIQHLGAKQGDIADESLRRRIRSLLVKAANRTKLPYAGTALYALAEDGSATPAQESELRRLTLALCPPDANAIARIAAIQLAGERGYAEALPLLREALSAPRRDAVTDVVCIGSLGLLGTADDIPLLRRFAVLGPRYATAAETAIKRIEERGSVDGKQH